MAIYVLFSPTVWLLPATDSLGIELYRVGRACRAEMGHFPACFWKDHSQMPQVLHLSSALTGPAKEYTLSDLHQVKQPQNLRRALDFTDWSVTPATQYEQTCSPVSRSLAAETRIPQYLTKLQGTRAIFSSTE